VHLILIFTLLALAYAFYKLMALFYRAVFVAKPVVLSPEEEQRRAMIEGELSYRRMIDQQDELATMTDEELQDLLNPKTVPQPRPEVHNFYSM
jgi:hypothetical protein